MSTNKNKTTAKKAATKKTAAKKASAKKAGTKPIAEAIGDLADPQLAAAGASSLFGDQSMLAFQLFARISELQRSIALINSATAGVTNTAKVIPAPNKVLQIKARAGKSSAGGVLNEVTFTFPSSIDLAAQLAGKTQVIGGVTQITDPAYVARGLGIWYSEALLCEALGDDCDMNADRPAQLW